MPSIHDLLPTEYGGPIARAGFQYQDDVAVLFCIQMLNGSGAIAIWCELLDDITLIWSGPDGDAPEFVQVKSERGEQMWTVAMLCGRTNNRPGTSIAEKSLAHDRVDEQCSFRIVTAADIAPELRPLATERTSLDRAGPVASFEALCQRIRDRVPDARSPNGNDLKDWSRRVLWEVRGAQQALRREGETALTAYLHETYGISAPDQVGSVYELLLKTVFDAALADARTSPDAKKVRHEPLSTEVLVRVRSLREPAPPTGGTRLRNQLSVIGLPEVEIDQILEAFFRHSAKARRGEYLDLGNRNEVDNEVDRLLQRLRLQRLAGMIEGSDLAFHNHCLDELTALWERLPTISRPAREYLVVQMYERVNRGLHRFIGSETGAAA